MKKSKTIWKMLAIVLAAALTLPANVGIAESKRVLETDVAQAGEDCTMLGLYGSYISQAQEALDKINEIRKEACDAGNVPDPRNASRYLTSSDYVPLKWSSDLENIARIRAAEGGMARGFMDSGHDRLNKKGTFSVCSNGIDSDSEVLAYYWKQDMVEGVLLWDMEKKDWLAQDDSKVTGHYTSMINPKFRYVGFGAFYTEAAPYPMTMAGEFSMEPELDETMQEAPTDVVQKIEVSNAFVKETYLEGDDWLIEGGTTTLTPRVTIQRGYATRTLWSLSDVTYTSSNPEVASVTEEGVVTGKSIGTTTITAKSGDSIVAQKEIEVQCDHQYTFSAIDANGKSTARCTVCGKEIQVAPPTQMDVYWRNSTSFSSSYSTRVPTENPVGSKLYCWTQLIGGDSDWQDIVMESSNEKVACPPKKPSNDSPYDAFDLLADGVTQISVYPKYNPALKQTFTLRVGTGEEQESTANPTAGPSSSPDASGKPITQPTAQPSASSTPVTPIQSSAPAVPTQTPAADSTVKPETKMEEESSKQTVFQDETPVERKETMADGTSYLKKGSTFIGKGLRYKVTAANTARGVFEVTCIGSKSKKIKSVTIPNFVKYKGVSYRVTGIGAKAFSKCYKLKTVKIQSKYLQKKKIGKNAFSGIRSRVSLQVPASKWNAYRKWFKKAGLRSR